VSQAEQCVAAFVAAAFGCAASLSCGTVWSASTYQEVVEADGPIAYYRLDEQPGASAATDQTGTHHGTYRNGPTLAVPGAILTDPANTAAGFNRVDSQYVELTTLGDFGSEMVNGYTLEYWARFRNSTAGQGVLGTGNPGFTTNLGIDIANHDPGELRVYCRDDDWNRFEARYYPEGDNIDIYDGRWHHLAHVFDPFGAQPASELVDRASGDRVIYYVDSVQQEISVSTHVPLGASDFVYPMLLAAWNGRGTPGVFFDGDLDEVAFYMRPLKGGEVAEHYAAAVPEPSALVLLCAGALGLLALARRRRK